MMKVPMTAVMAAVALGAFAEPAHQEAAKKAAPAPTEAKTDVIDLEEANAEGVKLKVNGDFASTSSAATSSRCL